MTMRTLALVFLSITVVPVHTNQFIKEHGIDLFTPEDIEFLEQAVIMLLESAADGDRVSWQNPSTGANGTLELLRSYEKDLYFCREVEVVAVGRGFTDQYRRRFCRDDNFQWNADN